MDVALFADGGAAGLARYWLALLPAALGFVGVYCLLPQAKGGRPMLGTLLGGAALALTGWLLLRHDGILPERILFYAFSALAIVGGGMVLAQRNPVHAALSFALVVLSTCGLFLLLAAPFLMAATIIVYAGAIVVTFLFVIMLAQQAGLASADQRSREPFLASLAGYILIGALLCVLEKTFDARTIDAALERIDAVARAESVDDARRQFGEIRKLFDDPQKPGSDRTLPVDEMKRLIPQTDQDLLEAEFLLNARDLPKLKAMFRKLHQQGLQARLSIGVLTADEKQPATPFSQGPLDAAGRHALPAQNVAGLGRTLFADYLLPIELAGILLLVASIGAIAIAARRPEGLR
ncbi:MAG: hypothetical protein FJ271_31345 [Planctomycetes bacterium]|nr:hypothetical protein [Planctomycetota bacterium]